MVSSAKWFVSDKGITSFVHSLNIKHTHIQTVCLRMVGETPFSLALGDFTIYLESVVG
jgi:hypothetical protein